MPTMLGGHWDSNTNSWNPNPGYDRGGDPYGSSASTSFSSPSQQDEGLGKNLSVLTAVMGGITSAIGSFYAAKTAQNQYKSAAMTYQFRSDMAAINARSAENDAQSILEAGKSQVQQYTMRAGQEKAATTASTAARGVALGVGSTRDVAASQDVVKDIDMMTINSNATRAAWAQRTQATNYKNEALLDNVSSQNALSSSRSISPFGAGFTSLLGSASSIASQWNYQRGIQTSAARGNY